MHVSDEHSQKSQLRVERTYTRSPVMKIGIQSRSVFSVQLGVSSVFIAALTLYLATATF